MDTQAEKLELHRLIRRVERATEEVADMARRTKALEALCRDAGLIPDERPELQVIEGGGAKVTAAERQELAEHLNACRSTSGPHIGCAFERSHSASMRSA